MCSQLADQENEQRRRLELAALEALNKPNEEVMKRNKLNQKKQQVSEGGSPGICYDMICNC
jgi:hypothetical protein